MRTKDIRTHLLVNFACGVRSLAKRATQMGLEPTTFRSEVERAIHCATKPCY